MTEPSLAAPPWAIRRMDPSDLAYVMSTWARVASKSRWLRSMPPGVLVDPRLGFRRHQDAIVERASSGGDAAVWVACDPEQREILYGYVIVESGAVHVAYTRESFRRKGIAHSLIAAAGVKGDTATLDPPEWARRRGVEHDPFVAPICGHNFRAWCLAWRTAFGEFRITGS